MRKTTTIMLNELKHFYRSPSKIVALILYIGASVYGLQNGYHLLQSQRKEIAAIELKNSETIGEVNAWFDAGKKGPDDKPGLDITLPARAVALAPATAIKSPSPLMIFSIGQAEHYGYYKQVTARSTTFDNDLAAEIANPERLAIGTLDFSFTLLYLLPILSIILLFNIGGLERDLGFDKLLEVSHASTRSWLLARFSFYFLLVALVLLLLTLGYGIAGNGLSITLLALYGLMLAYLLLWFAGLYLINLKGKGSADQAIKMASLWLLMCIIVPGAVHQTVALNYPANYMTDYLDANREQSYKLFDQPSDSLRQSLFAAYPALAKTEHAKDTATNDGILKGSIRALTNQLVKNATARIEAENEHKNRIILLSSFFNPVTWFQNMINGLCQTDYYAYKAYRSDIQRKIDQKIELIMFDNWNKISVDKKRFLHYIETFKNNP